MSEWFPDGRDPAPAAIYAPNAREVAREIITKTIDIADPYRFDVRPTVEMSGGHRKIPTTYPVNGGQALAMAVDILRHSRNIKGE